MLSHSNRAIFSEGSLRVSSVTMKTALIIWLSVLLASPAFCAGVDNEPADVSIIRLIAAPRDFAGKVVRVVGYLSIEFEGDAIYLHEEDCRRSLTTNGLAIDGEPNIRNKLKELTGKYVIIEGVFDPSAGGHMNLFSGGIGAITRADAWDVTPAAAPPSK
jgi:hypothetical protein